MAEYVTVMVRNDGWPLGDCLVWIGELGSDAAAKRMVASFAMVHSSTFVDCGRSSSPTARASASGLRARMDDVESHAPFERLLPTPNRDLVLRATAHQYWTTLSGMN